MREFDEIIDFRSNKDKLFESYCEESGLPLNLVKTLHESGTYQSLMEGRKTEIALEVGEKHFKELLKQVGTASKEAIQEMCIKLLEESDGSNFWNLFKAVMLMILTKNNQSFKRTEERAIDKNLKTLIRQNTDLMEAFNMDENFLSISKQPFDGFNVNSSIDRDITFYGSLRNVLQSRSNIFENNLRAKSAYQSIQEYLEKEIEYLTNKDMIHSVDTSQSEIIYKQLLGGYLSPENKQPDIIKSCIVDTQAFVFDLILIVCKYEENQNHIRQHVNSMKYTKFKQASKDLLNEILSARKSSKLFDINEYLESNNIDDSIFAYLKLNAKANWGVFIHDKSLSYKTVEDCLLMIKNLQGDFNIKIRKYINNFITAAINYLSSVEKIRQRLISHELR